MTDWKECKLGDIADIVMGQSPKGETCNSNQRGLPLLNGPTEYGIKHPKPVQYTVDPKRLAKKGDILFCVRGSTTGRMNWADQEYAIGRGIAAVRHKQDKNINSFIKGLIDYYLPSLLSGAAGSVFPNITGSQLSEVPIFLPPLPEQRAISGVLSSLDDKIDLLHRQNKTLEGMAEALWRKMFVEEVDSSWKETSLLEIIDLVGGGTPKTEIAAYWDGSVPWLSAKDITANHKRFIFQTEKNISELGLENSSAIFLPKYATIISARGTVGNYCILSSPMAFSQSNYGVLPKIDGCFYFTYLLIAFIVDELKSAAYGSVFDTITTNTFREQKIILPEKGKILFFEKEIKYYFEKLYNNTIQIRTLSHLRDTLLTKLMAGVVRVTGV